MYLVNFVKKSGIMCSVQRLKSRGVRKSEQNSIGAFSRFSLKEIHFIQSLRLSHDEKGLKQGRTTSLRDYISL